MGTKRYPSRSSRKDLSSRLSPAPVNTGWHLNPGGSATGVFCSLVPKRHSVAAPGVASYIGREHGHEPSVYPLANHGLPDGSAGSFLGHRYSKISLRFSSNSALSISPFANRSFKISMKRSRGPPALRRHALSDGRSTLACSSLLYRGGLVSSAFRLLRRSGVGCHSQDPRFSSGSALWPSHDGIRRMRRTNLPRRPCRKTYGRHKDSKRTRLIHRPCGDIAPLVGGIHVFSCRVLLCTTRCEIRHDARHKCALTARSLLFAQSR